MYSNVPGRVTGFRNEYIYIGKELVRDNTH